MNTTNNDSQIFSAPVKTEGTFEGYCILEVMGHRKLAGYIKEASIAGTSFIRLDVFNEAEKVTATQFYNPSSIYCITPCTKKMAIAYGIGHQPAPVQEWEIPELKQLLNAPAQPVPAQPVQGVAYLEDSLIASPSDGDEFDDAIPFTDDEPDEDNKPDLADDDDEFTDDYGIPLS